jgi:hypothetical protein
MYLLPKEYEKVLNGKPEDQIQLFFEYCHKLINLKENDFKIREEDVGHSIVGVLLRTELTENDDINNIFDLAAEMEISRESIKYAEQWDENYANKLK